MLLTFRSGSGSSLGALNQMHFYSPLPWYRKQKIAREGEESVEFAEHFTWFCIICKNSVPMLLDHCQLKFSRRRLSA